VTRGDIEEIRGVGVSAQILKTLEARGWIDEIGMRDVPGKPALFATTKQLLDDLNLRSLQELPSLEEMGNLLEQDGS
jgi:segregation and condensation protein B